MVIESFLIYANKQSYFFTDPVALMLRFFILKKSSEKIGQKTAVWIWIDGTSFFCIIQLLYCDENRWI